MFFKLLIAALIASTPYLAADNRCDCPHKNHLIYRTDAYVQGNNLVNKFSFLFSQLVSSNDNVYQNNVITTLENEVLGTPYIVQFSSLLIPATSATNRTELLALATAIYNVSNPTLITANNTYPIYYSFTGCARTLSLFTTHIIETSDRFYTDSLFTTWGSGNYDISEYACDVFRINSAVIQGGIGFSPCCSGPGLIP